MVDYRAALSLVLLTAALAGCTGGDELEPDVDDVGDTAPPSRAVLHSAGALLNGSLVSSLGPDLAPLLSLNASWLSVAGMDAREPTVGVTSDGAVYFAARDYSGGNVPPVSATQTPIMKSVDGGATWTDVSPRMATGDREPPRSGDPMVWVDPWTDRIFQIELYDLVCNWLVFSDDGGDSWTGNPKACGTVVVDHQTIGAGPAVMPTTQTVGYPNVVYVCVNQLLESNCARSLNGGLVFEPSVPVYPGVRGPDLDQTCGGIHGHVLVGPDGTVYLPREYCGDAFVAISRDDGLTWQLVDVDGGFGASDQDPNMAFDSAGNIYYLWVADDEQIHLTWSGDAGTTWSPPMRVTPPDVTASNHPSMTAGEAGRIGFVYLATKDPIPAPDANWTGVTWQAYLGASLDALSDQPTFAVVQANPAGDLVYRGDCTHQRCGFIREFLDATLAPDGTFYAAFVDACLPESLAKYKTQTPGDCDTEAKRFGEGNGHLAYVARLAGDVRLVQAAPAPG